MRGPALCGRWGLGVLQQAISNTQEVLQQVGTCEGQGVVRQTGV